MLLTHINDTLKEIMPKYGIELIEIERQEYKKGEYISASKVRELVKSNKVHEIKGMVPEITWKFLNSNKGKEILEKIHESNSPH